MPSRPVNGVPVLPADEATANEQLLVAREHELHPLGRAVFGYVGQSQYEGLRSAMRSTGSSFAAAVCLGAMAGSIAAQVLSWQVLQPLWSLSLGIGSVQGF